MMALSKATFKSIEMCSHLCFSQVSSYRKFALKMALFLLITICLLMRYQTSNSGHTRAHKCHCQSQPKKYHLMLDRTRQAPQSKVLIISEARSGSSFLGDLLQQASPTYYSFEPLVGVATSSKLYDQLLYKIFQCQFDNLLNTYLRPIYWKIQYFRWNSLLVDNCDRHDPIELFNHTTHRMLCTNSDTILVKTIRFTLKDYWRTIDHYENKLSVKVIYLVRDPRAVMSSRYRMTWCQNTENCTNSEVLCQRMRNNINILKQIKSSALADSATLVRHEDLLLDMMYSVKQLLQFVKINSTRDQRVTEWIRTHTSVDDLLSNPHSTYRNIKALASQWKADLAPDELVEIEDNCADVMRQLGYRPVVEQNQTEQDASENSGSTEGDNMENFEYLRSDYPLRGLSVW